MEIFKIIGALGLIFISLGVLTKRRETQDVLYILGGISLGVYSLSIKEGIFIILQTIFTLAAIYDLIKLKVSKK